MPAFSRFLTPRVLPHLLSLLIVLIVFSVYGQVKNFGFLVWDDYDIIYTNPLYNPPSPEKLAAVWQGPLLDLYIPLTYTLWAAIGHFAWQQEPQMAPLNVPTHLAPQPFHLANLFLHIACALLVYALLKRCFKISLAGPSTQTNQWREIGAACGALFFALHPLQVESVAWISELKGLLSSFFVLAALWQFLLSLQPEMPEKSRIFTRFHGAVAAFFYLLAVLSKPSALPAPLLALVLAHFLASLSWRDAAKRLGLWWIIMLAAAIVAQRAQPVYGISIPLWQRPFIAGDALAFYAGKVLMPWSLASNYARTPSIVLENWWFYIAWIIPAALLLVAWRGKLLKTAMLLWLIPLLPVLGLVTFAYQRLSTVADRYAFLSLLGPAFLVAWLVNQRKSPVILGFVCVYVTGLGLLSLQQIKYWADNESLFGHTLQVAPRSWVAKANLGALAQANGQKEQALQWYYQALNEPTLDPISINDYGLVIAQMGDMAGAEKAFLRAISKDATYGRAWSNLGTVYVSTGRNEQAIETYRKATTLLPDSAETYLNLGLAYATGRNTQEAIGAYKNALRFKPDDAETLYNLGLAYANEKDYPAAQTSFAAAAQAKPDYWEARHALGLTLHLQGQTDKALNIWRALVDENPSFAPTRQILSSLKNQKPK